MKHKKRLMFVFGTRPEAIKMAPLINAVKKQTDFFTPLVVVTGQHRQMLDQVLALFNIKPDHDLAIMRPNQSLVDIVTGSMQGLEKVVQQEKPAMILAQGDTSTTFAAGLIAHYHHVPLGHIEAGLRTFDKWKPFPEEINRKLTTALADLHFAPTTISAQNLKAEGVPPETIYLTGNTVIDALLEVANKPYDLERIGINLDPAKKMILVTTHRRENFGGPLENICQAIVRIAQTYRDIVEIILPVHRNPNVRDVVFDKLQKIENIKLIEPLDYEPFVHLMKTAYLLLTDSGGVQEEGPSLGKPVLVMREKTERPEAVTAGTVKLVGMEEENIYASVCRLLEDKTAYALMSQAVNPYGDGKASERIVKVLLNHFGFSTEKPEDFNLA